MIGADYLIEGLERVFTEIEQNRMQDVPVINKALKVKAVGFTSWNNHCLGVMLTPWFMNLMLLPNEADDWKGFSYGEKITHVFPSGPYEFTMGYEEGIGRYQMCSLFSPMFDFVDQEAAIATALSVMDSLMNEEYRDENSTRTNEIKRIWQGEAANETTELAQETQTEMRSTLEQRLEKPISRRELLRANFLRES